MSKTLDLLEQAQKQKVKKVSLQHAKTFNLWIVGLTAVVMFFGILGFNVKIFNKARLNDFERNELSAKVDKMQEQINSNNAVIEKLTDILDRVTLKIKDTNTRITEMEKDKDSQSFAIENLTKAKSTIYNRVSSLEAELEDTKKQNGVKTK